MDKIKKNEAAFQILLVIKVDENVLILEQIYDNRLERTGLCKLQ